MAIIQEKKLDIPSLLMEYNRNSENRKLKDYYGSATIFDIIRKGRNETAHSAFLAWLFSNRNIICSSTENPIIGLLDILIRRSKNLSPETEWYQKYNSHLDAISNALLSRTLKTEVREVATEKEVNSFIDPKKHRDIYQSNDKRGGDSLDIYIKCNVAGLTDITTFEFFIENKIGSNEGGPKKDPVCDYDKKAQTERYYYACKREDASTIQFFIFLKAASESELTENNLCKSSNYIRINYQDIYDDILSPLLDSGRLSNKEQYLIEEYVKVLSLPMIFRADDDADSNFKDVNNNYNTNVNTAMILAVSPREKQTLYEYWNRNRELIIATLQSCYSTFKNEKISLEKIQKKNKKLVDEKECIKLAFDEFVQHVNIKSGYIERYIQEKEIVIPSVARVGQCYKIDKWTASHKPIITDIKDKYKEQIIQKLSLDCNKSDKIETIKKAIEKKYQDQFNSIKNSEDIKKVAAYFFNKELCESIKGIKTIFETDGSWSKDTSSKYHDIYCCIKDGEKLDFKTYKCIIDEITYDEKFIPVLCDFWSVNKQLIMAAIRVISNERSEELSADFIKSIKLLYRDFNKN